MRLIRMKEDGDVSLEEHAEEDEPSYAILSHRWGEDNDEVTFKDLSDQTYRDKRGYAKLRGCGEQANRDGHQLFWVDTCCIDKSSSAELSESINSMWRWYCKSKVCYVYLDDVPADIKAAEKEAAFTESKWFTRGWTLQELLGPPRLEIYDAEWNLIGTKDDLAGKISHITKINERYLRSNTSILSASVAERMSWASKRTTKRLEDMAYCLLGIFDINMPLLYGEGKKAFQRLQEEILKHSDDQSILAWSSPSAKDNNGRVFAHSPAEFVACGNIVRSIQTGPVRPYAITNKGLEIGLPLARGYANNQLCAVLNCRRQHDTFANLAVPVKQVDNSHQYQRQDGELQTILITDLVRVKVQPIYVSMTRIVDYSRNHLKDNTSILRKLPKNVAVSQIFPSGPWPHETRTFEANRVPSCPQDPSNRTLVMLSAGPSHRYLFMTFFHKNRFFHEYVWDARLLPVLVDDSSDMEQLFDTWKCQDLSTLKRVHRPRFRTILLRTVPQIIQGRRVTTIDVFFLPPVDPALREITEQARMILRAIGYRISRALYWMFDPLLGGLRVAESLILTTPLIMSHFFQSEDSVGAPFLILSVTIVLFVTWTIWRTNQNLPPVSSVALGWQDVRNIDVTIGCCASLVVFLYLPFILLVWYLGYSLKTIFPHGLMLVFSLVMLGHS